MAGHQRFRDLRGGLTSERRDRVDQRANAMASELFQADLRELTRRDHIDVAQVTIDRMKQIVRSLGGELELTVVYPGGERVPLFATAPVPTSSPAEPLVATLAGPT